MKTVYRLLMLVSLPLFLMTSCDEFHEVTMEEIHDFEDAVGTEIPTAYTLHTRVHKGSEEVDLIVQVGSFYNASESDKRVVAVKVGQSLIETLSDEVKKGTLILTNEVDRNRNKDPKDALYIDMKIDSLRSVLKSAQKGS